MRFKLMNRALQNNVAYDVVTDEKPFERTVICIQESQRIHKVLSISASKKDGSLYVFPIYCKAKDAFATRYKLLLNKGPGYKINSEDIVNEATVNIETKMSLHSDGFMQLSGTGITSGIDQDGNAKGIGIFSNPHDDPIMTGPTFGFQCWGLEKGFDILEKQKKNTQYIILNRDHGDFTERQSILDFQPNTYLLEFFIFPLQANEFIYHYKDHGPYIDHIVPRYQPIPGKRFACPVIDLKSFKGVLALTPFVSGTGFPIKHDYGYILASPGGSIRRSGGRGDGYRFMLSCPRRIMKGLSDKVYPLEFR